MRSMTPPPFDRRRSARIAAVLLLAAAPLVAARAELVDLALSPRARHLAQLDDTGTLSILTVSTPTRTVARFDAVVGETVVWHPEGTGVAAARRLDRGWDLWFLGLDGRERRLTVHPARDADPAFLGDGRRLAFVSWRRGDADLFVYDFAERRVEPLVVLPLDQWAPAARPGAAELACLAARGEAGAELGRVRVDATPRYGVWADSVGLAELRGRPFSWAVDGSALVCVEPVGERGRVRVLDAASSATYVVEAAGRLRGKPFLEGASGALWIEERRGLVRIDAQGRGARVVAPSRPEGLDLSKLSMVCTTSGTWKAAVADESLAAVSAPSGVVFAVAPADAADRWRLVEALLRRERYDAAQRAFAELIDAVTSETDVFDVRLDYAERLWLAGRPEAALDQLDLAGKQLLSTEQQAQVLALRGEISLYSLGDLDSARAFLRRSALAAPEMTERLVEPLAILATGDEDLIGLYRRAYLLHRRGRDEEAMEPIEQLGETYGGEALVLNLLLRLLSDPPSAEAQDVPNLLRNPRTSGRAIEILHALVRRRARETVDAVRGAVEQADVLADPGPSDDATLTELQQKLFEALVDARRFDEARQLAGRVVRTRGAEDLGVIGFLRFYIEIQRHENPAHKLLGQVFLSPDVASMLEARWRDDPGATALLALARVKYELLEGELEAVPQRLEAARAALGRAETDADDGPFDDRLRVVLALCEAKYLECRALWSEALEAYDRAVGIAERRAPDWLEMYLGLRAARSQILRGRSRPDLLGDLLLVQRGTGDPLLNPTNDRDALLLAAEALRNLRRNHGPSPLDASLHLQTALYLARAREAHDARAEYHRAMRAAPSADLFAAILWESAGLHESTENDWLAARALERLESVLTPPVSRETVRLRRAQLLMGLGQTVQARAALLQLVGAAQWASTREAAARMLEAIAWKSEP